MSARSPIEYAWRRVRVPEPAVTSAASAHGPTYTHNRWTLDWQEETIRHSHIDAAGWFIDLRQLGALRDVEAVIRTATDKAFVTRYDGEQLIELLLGVYFRAKRAKR